MKIFSKFPKDVFIEGVVLKGNTPNNEVVDGAGVNEVVDADYKILLNSATFKHYVDNGVISVEKTKVEKK